MTPHATRFVERALVAIVIGLIAMAGVGGSSALAQAPDPTPVPGASLPLPIECTEQDARTGLPDSDGDGVIDDCVDFYVEQEVFPPTTPESTTTTTVAGSLPQTGSSVSPVLAIGTALMVGGAMVVVATRRRSAATSG